MNLNRVNHRKSSVFCSLIIFVTIISGLIGCSDSEVTPREGSLNGKITTIAGGPLEGALVKWTADGNKYSYTDENGVYNIHEVSFGTQKFEVSRAGYKEKTFTAPIYSGITTEAKDVSVESKSFSYSDIKITEVSSGHAVITWKTSDYTYGMVEYGTTDAFGSAVKETDADYSTVHTLRITGLNPETRYFFRIRSSRQNQPAETSVTGQFTTISTLEDTTPPSAPEDVSTALNGIPGRAVVYWKPVHDKDIKGYKIYRSESKNGVYRTLPIGQSIPLILSKGVENHVDDTVVPGKKYYYRVTAIDQADNESGYNGDSDGILVPGRISGHVRWTVANSPYIIKGSLNVTEFGGITVDDGVKVLIDPMDAMDRNGSGSKIGITVSGRLITSSGPASVIFAANTQNPASNYWKGIIFDNAVDDANDVSNAIISDAECGITIKNSSNIKVRSSQFINCHKGIACVGSKNSQLSQIQFKRCPKNIYVKNTEKTVISGCLSQNADFAVETEGNTDLTVKDNNFIQYKYGAVKSNDTDGSIIIANNLFVSENAAQSLIVEGNATSIEYNTFDAPFGICIHKGEPIVQKNLIMSSAETSVYGSGKVGIEYKYTYKTPTFGPNNVNGFTEPYVGCKASKDSTDIKVKFRKDISGSRYDYRLRVDHPDSEDPWGIKRESDLIIN